MRVKSGAMNNKLSKVKNIASRLQRDPLVVKIHVGTQIVRPIEPIKNK